MALLPARPPYVSPRAPQSTARALLPAGPRAPPPPRPAAPCPARHAPGPDTAGRASAAAPGSWPRGRDEHPPLLHSSGYPQTRARHRRPAPHPGPRHTALPLREVTPPEVRCKKRPPWCAPCGWFRVVPWPWVPAVPPRTDTPPSGSLPLGGKLEAEPGKA
jgi:hypothetical protein